MKKTQATMMVSLVVGLCAIFIIAKRPRGEYQYRVFKIDQGRLTILSGIPKSYDLDKIEGVNFSYIKGRRENYMGIMRVIKIGGSKSRPFIFDSSQLKKKAVFTTLKADIEATIEYLIDELKSHNIPCSSNIGEKE